MLFQRRSILFSNTLAIKCNWDVWEEASMGSDHFPVITSIQVEKEQADEMEEMGA